MEFEKALDEGFKESAGGLFLAASILLASFGLQRQNQTIDIAQEFLNDNPVYIEKLEDLRSVGAFDKREKNRIISDWKNFIRENDLDPRLARGLDMVGAGKLAAYRGSNEI
mgnify:CR=1 FL=1|jgi:hypothetical protein